MLVLACCGLVIVVPPLAHVRESDSDSQSQSIASSVKVTARVLLAGG